MSYKTATTAAAAALFAVIATGSHALPADLSSWTAEGWWGDWELQSGNTSVKQTLNSSPTVFYEGVNAKNSNLSATVKVDTSFDDDFIGFVLGYDAGEIYSTAKAADFWLVSWKQADQTIPGAFGPAGLSLSHVTGPSDFDMYYGKTGNVTEVASATHLGSTGWDDLTTYDFDFTFTDSLIEVFVDGVLEISYAGSFGDGSFGFYTQSQQDVLFTREFGGTPASAVPLPAALPLMLGGFGLLGAAGLRRAKRKA